MGWSLGVLSGKPPNFFTCGNAGWAAGVKAEVVVVVVPAPPVPVSPPPVPDVVPPVTLALLPPQAARAAPQRTTPTRPLRRMDMKGMLPPAPGARGSRESDTNSRTNAIPAPRSTAFVERRPEPRRASSTHTPQRTIVPRARPSAAAHGT